jgi:hypothetical protein
MKDAATPTITAENTTAFQSGEIAVTAKSNLGIHFGQKDTDIGPEFPPNYIFLEANFSAAVTPRTYKTSALRVEYFRQ